MSQPNIDEERTLADLDSSDQEILQCVLRDGRMSTAQIARESKLSEPTVRKRLDMLLSDGLIKICAVVNPRRTGLASDVLVGFRAKPGSAARVVEQLIAFPNVLYIGHTTGRFDIIADMLFKDDIALYEFLTDGVASITDLVSVETFHILRAERVDFDWRPGRFLLPTNSTH